MEQTKTNEQQKQIHKYRELMVARGEGLGGINKVDEGEWEVQASSYGMNKSQG